MNYTQIEALIKSKIDGNGEKKISGPVLQEVLLAMIAPQAQREHPFTLTALEDGVFNLAKGDEYYDQIALEFRKNEGEWAAYEFGTPIACTAGDTIQLRGNNGAMSYIDTEGGTQMPYWNWQGFSGSWKASGNIMSLLHKESFAKATSVPLAGFMGLFSGRTGGFAQLTDASELLLPATTLAQSCYAFMFYGCKGLTSAPELPATTLASNCYADMFHNCTSLVAAPELPATTLASTCYTNMFRYCTGLTSAPALPATILAESCYYGMFNGCTNLVAAPELPATILAESCYWDMFSGCTNLVAAPELPATALVGRCYYGMFNGCSKLAEVRCRATSISATAALTNWLRNVSTSGTFYKAAGVTYPTGMNGIPSGWAIKEIS